MSNWNFNPMGLIDGVFGNVMAGHRARQQHRRTKELMGIQQNNQMELNKQGNQLGKDMFDYTFMPIDKLKQKGMNPSLLYGMGGAGGTTAGSPSGGSAQGGQGSKADTSPLGMMESMLLDAQIKNINADTNQKQANADKTSGIDTEVGKASLSKIIAETSNEELKGKLTQAQTDLINIENAYKPQLIESELKDYKAKLNNLVQQTELTKDQYSSLVREAEGKAILQWAQVDLAKSSTKVNEEKAKQIGEQIEQVWYELELKQYDRVLGKYDSETQRRGQITNEFRAKIEKILGAGNLDAKNRKIAIDGLLGILSVGKKPPTQTKETYIPKDGNGKIERTTYN